MEFLGVLRNDLRGGISMSGAASSKGPLDIGQLRDYAIRARSSEMMALIKSLSPHDFDAISNVGVREALKLAKKISESCDPEQFEHFVKHKEMPPMKLSNAELKLLRGGFAKEDSSGTGKLAASGAAMASLGALGAAMGTASPLGAGIIATAAVLCVISDALGVPR